VAVTEDLNLKIHYATVGYKSKG